MWNPIQHHSKTNQPVSAVEVESGALLREPKNTDAWPGTPRPFSWTLRSTGARKMVGCMVCN